MTPTSAERQVEPVDVDEGEQRRGGDQAAAVEPLGEGDPPEHGPLAQGADGVAGGERRRRAPPTASAARRTRPRRRDRRSRPGPRPVGPPRRSAMRPPANAATAPRRRPTHTQEPDDAAAQPGRIHRPPQAQVERPAERQAEPEHDRDGDHHRRRSAQMKSDEQRGGAEAAQDRELARRRGPEPAGEHAQQVRDERRRGERGETDRLEPAAAGDRRQEGGDERQP